MQEKETINFTIDKNVPRTTEAEGLNALRKQSTEERTGVD